ncbi:hypothetical protein EVAR_15071_1 [Eumeta japonica]|uniref:Uncharacterized protein n=1 Tax=Eumeta variegata TaxID=151549 RepID=A0A4C1YLR9_EUMVA|nr:hypothetical protein EVAR_15071_1 [Eumeta japonica]
MTHQTVPRAVSLRMTRALRPYNPHRGQCGSGLMAVGGSACSPRHGAHNIIRLKLKAHRLSARKWRAQKLFITSFSTGYTSDRVSVSPYILSATPYRVSDAVGAAAVRFYGPNKMCEKRMTPPHTPRQRPP